MISELKYTITDVNNSKQVRASFKVSRNTFQKNAPLDLENVIKFSRDRSFLPAH